VLPAAPTAGAVFMPTLAPLAAMLGLAVAVIAAPLDD
jgi:hypothetical protein